MDYQYPIILISLPIIIILFVFLFYLSEKKNKINIHNFIGSNKNRLLPPTNTKIKIIRYILLLVSMLLLGLTISRPQNGFTWQEQTTTGIDIVVAVDTSKSMDAIDVKPNRLTRSKLALLELSSKLKGDRIALIPFAGSSFVMTPLTADYTIFEQSITALNTSTIPKGGTNLSSAIATAEEIFKNKNSHKILILVTDGEDLANQGIKEAQRVSANGIQIFTIGVGTNEGELIPDPNKQGSYLKDKNGSFVKSKLDENSLKEIANSTGGDYRHISSGGNGILQIYNDKLLELEQENKSEQRSRVPVDKYRWFLLPVILLLLLEFIIVNIKIRNNKKVIFTMLTLFSISSLFATPGDDALKNGNINKAIELYQKEKPSNETLFNLGSAYYMNGDYQNAIIKYKEGLSKSSGEFQSKILFNLGNSFYRASENDENEKMNLLKQALKSYNGAIELGNKDEKVEKNRDYVKKILDQLEQDQQNNDQQNDDQQNDDQQNNDQQNDDQQNNDQQNNDQQNNDQQNNDQQNNDQQNNDQQNDDQQNDDQQNDDQQNDDQQNNDQQNNDQQHNANASEDQQDQQQTQEMSAQEAEALLKALESEDVDIKYLLNDNNNSYTGEW